jgi:hypothetical protein
VKKQSHTARPIESTEVELDLPQDQINSNSIEAKAKEAGKSFNDYVVGLVEQDLRGAGLQPDVETFTIKLPKHVANRLRYLADWEGGRTVEGLIVESAISTSVAMMEGASVHVAQCEEEDAAQALDLNASPEGAKIVRQRGAEREAMRAEREVKA